MHVYRRVFIKNDFFTQIVAVMPPSAMNIPPVQNDASSEARKATKLAISSFLARSRLVDDVVSFVWLTV